MPIAVFDIDGTLTDTMAVDLECYEGAILEMTGVALPSEWPAFEDVTDATILVEACRLQDRPVPDVATQALIAERVGWRAPGGLIQVE